jgi:hypothetical protein
VRACYRLDRNAWLPCLPSYTAVHGASIIHWSVLISTATVEAVTHRLIDTTTDTYIHKLQVTTLHMFRTYVIGQIEHHIKPQSHCNTRPCAVHLCVCICREMIAGIITVLLPSLPPRFTPKPQHARARPSIHLVYPSACL